MSREGRFDLKSPLLLSDELWQKNGLEVSETLVRKDWACLKNAELLLAAFYIFLTQGLCIICYTTKAPGIP